MAWLAPPLRAQNPPEVSAADSARLAISQGGSPWKRVGGTTLDAGLAAPATGPVAALWYEAGAGRLLAQTASFRIFETADFTHWRLNTLTSAPGPAQLSATAGSRQYVVASANVYASDDGGRTWINLTGFNNRSVIGDGFTALAVAPGNSREIAVANRFGIWRSLDGGLSWTGLNQDLPNLPARKLLDRRTLLLADGSLATLEAGAWVPAEGNDPESPLRARYAPGVGAELSAAASSGSIAYAGSVDGRLFVSRDGASTWNAPTRVGEAVSRIWIDVTRPDVALAASGSRLFRTVNGGLFWDEVTGELPPGAIHGIAADRSAGAVYLATDRGVFSATLSLNDAGAVAANWQSVSRDLPAAPAWDVRLNPDDTLTVALDGYGVFETAAPHGNRPVRIVSGADLSDRPAAPGSLISVLGANVQAVKVDDQSAMYPVLASSDRSSQLQVPFESATGTFSLALEGAAGRWTVPLTVREASPAIFVDADGSPLILDAASGLVVDPKLAVYGGSTVQVLATGLGKVTPEWPTGTPAPLDSPPAVAGSVGAYLDGRPVDVTRASLAPGYVGYYIVELQIPAIVNRGAGELRIVMNGAESNRVKLYLEPNVPLR